jgi:phytoene synthase
MDLTVRRYPTWPDLRLYCERVASAVGLACIEVFGYTQPGTRRYAEELGVALQLTNILRDVAADAARDRLYLPLSDLAEFGLSESDVMNAIPSPVAPARLRPLLDHEAERARAHYRVAERLLPDGDRRAMVSAEIMGAIYRALLEAVARRGFPLTADRVSLSRARKAWLAVRPRVRGRAAGRS